MGIVNTVLRAMQKSQIYKWLLARAIERQICNLRSYESHTDRRRWNFPTLKRRRAGDVCAGNL